MKEAEEICILQNKHS